VGVGEKAGRIVAEGVGMGVSCAACVLVGVGAAVSAVGVMLRVERALIEMVLVGAPGLMDGGKGLMAE